MRKMVVHQSDIFEDTALQSDIDDHHFFIGFY